MLNFKNQFQILSSVNLDESLAPAQLTPIPETPKASTSEKPKVSQLTRAFVDAKPSKKGSPDTAAIPEVTEIDIRKWGVSLRSALRTSPTIVIEVGDTEVAALPKPLLKFVSTNFEDIHKNGVVKLPEDTDADGVVRLITHFKIVMNARGKPIRMPNNLDVYESMSLLGAERYVDHIFRKLDRYFHNVDLPTYGDLDAALTFMDKQPRFLNVAVQKLAKLTREKKIEDVADWNKYLAQQPVLANAIEVANTNHADWLHAQELAVRREEESKKIAARKAEKHATDDAFWARHKKEDAEDRASIKKKLAGPVSGRKFTPRERKYYVRTYGPGTRLPRGA